MKRKSDQPFSMTMVVQGALLLTNDRDFAPVDKHHAATKAFRNLMTKDEFAAGQEAPQEIFRRKLAIRGSRRFVQKAQEALKFSFRGAARKGMQIRLFDKLLVGQIRRQPFRDTTLGSSQLLIDRISI
jgi:hypothetical protein